MPSCGGAGCQRISCDDCQDAVISRWVAGIDMDWDRYEPVYLDDDFLPPRKG